MINFKPLTHELEFLVLTKPQGKSISFHSGETVKAEVIDILPTGGVVVRMKGQYITIRTEIPLQKDLQLLLRVMETSVDGKLKLQFIGTVEEQKPKISISQLISELSNKVNIDLKKFDDILKIFLSEFNSIESSQKASVQFLFLTLLGMKEQTIQMRLNNLVNSAKKDSAIAKLFQSLLINPSNLNSEQIKHSILNSGILFETKLKEGKKQKISKDLKGNLLKLIYSLEKEGNKDKISEIKDLLTEIEIYQLLSKTTDSIYTFLPLFWEDINESNISFKKGKKENQFFCKIYLNFKEKGKFLILIMMFNKEFYLFFKVEDKGLEEKIRGNVKDLQESLKNLGLNLVGLNFLGNDTSFEKLQSFESLENLINFKT
jgi:hypothetical protein